MSRPMRGAWIETPRLNGITAGLKSRPMRGAWIET